MAKLSYKAKQKQYNVHELTKIALFTALTAVLAFIIIPLPFSPVPVSGQTLAIMLAGIFLGGRKAALSQLVYIILGTIGLPIFAGGNSGPGSLLGPSGGYLWGFVIGAFLIGKLLSQGIKSPLYQKIIALLIGGILSVYICGVGQLMMVTEMPLTAAITAGFLPFLPGDIFKIIIVLIISEKRIWQSWDNLA